MKFDLKSRKQASQAISEAIEDNVPTELANSYENVWGSNSQKIISIDISRLIPYKNKSGGQPYKMNENKISQIAESAKDIGIITPLQVRESDDNTYEIISGHHRFEAAKQIGLLKVPCVIVRNLDDEQIFQMMSESNIQRDRILPSEYGKMFTVYMSRKKDIEMTSVEIAKKFGVSPKTMYRYINVAKMIDVIQAMFDDEQINLCAIDNIADISEDTQNALYKALTDTGVKLSVACSKRIRELAEAFEENGDDDVNALSDEFADVITGREKKQLKQKFSNKVYSNIHKKYNLDMTEDELDEITAKLLDDYFSNLKKN